MTTTFATSDDVAAVLQRQLTDVETIAAVFLLEAATAEIQAETGQQILAGTDTVQLAGSWSSDLVLPQRPVSAVSAVSVNGVALATDSWDFNNNGVLRSGALSADFAADFGNALSNQGATNGDGLHWGGPSSTITVTYTFGETPVPANIKGLCVQVVLRSLTNPAGVRSEGLGGYNVVYTVPGTGQVFGQLLTDVERRRLRRLYARTAGTITAGR